MEIKTTKEITDENYDKLDAWFTFPEDSDLQEDGRKKWIDADELWISKKSIMTLEIECMKKFPNETGKQNMSFRRKLCDKLRSFR